MPPPLGQSSISVAPRQSSRRRRAPMACEKCHLRKVRCNLSTKGFPCANCEQDGIECALFRPKRSRIGNSPFQAHVQPVTQAPRTDRLDSSLPRLAPAQDSIMVDSSFLSPIQPLVSPPESHCRSIRPYPPQAADSLTPAHSEVEVPREDDIVNPGAFSVCLEEQESSGAAPFYVGDSQGLEFMLDICRPSRSERNHYPVTHAPVTKAGPGDIAYLQENGVFDLPSEELGRELLQLYIRHIHTWYPIVDIASLLQNYVAGGRRKPSPLLMWSIFSLAAAFLPIKSVQAAGFRSNKEMQHAWYRKAKCLYDMDVETDKITIIQSLAVLSHRYADTDDRSGPWHWIGVAISLSHTIGLHRNPSPKRSHFDSHMPLWRRVWWTCFYRETWLAMSHGRPMRIHPDDCDLPMPLPEDMWAGTADLPPEIQQTYLPEPEEREALSKIHLFDLKLAATLSTILRTHYRPRPVMPSILEIQSDEDIITGHSRECRRCRDYLEHPKALVQTRAAHVLIYYEILMILLYRPYLLKTPSTNGIPDLGDWQASALKKAKLAADNVSTMLNRLMSLETIKLCDPTIILAMKPAMQIYLLLSTSSNTLHQRHAFLQLELYMLVLREMPASCWTAGLTIDLFRKAMKKLAASRDARRLPSSERPRQDSQASIVEAEDASGEIWGQAWWAPPGNNPFDDAADWPIPSVSESWELALESVLDGEGLLGLPDE